jgi:hypothetical protein
MICQKCFLFFFFSLWNFKSFCMFVILNYLRVFGFSFNFFLELTLNSFRNKILWYTLIMEQKFIFSRYLCSSNIFNCHFFQLISVIFLLMSGLLKHLKNFDMYIKNIELLFLLEIIHASNQMFDIQNLGYKNDSFNNSSLILHCD